MSFHMILLSYLLPSTVYSVLKILFRNHSSTMSNFFTISFTYLFCNCILLTILGYRNPPNSLQLHPFCQHAGRSIGVFFLLDHSPGLSLGSNNSLFIVTSIGQYYLFHYSLSRNHINELVLLIKLLIVHHSHLCSKK